jgi:hypothetical protein
MLSRAGAEQKRNWEYANNNLHRLEPLLTKQFVTVDQVDHWRMKFEAAAWARCTGSAIVLFSHVSLVPEGPNVYSTRISNEPGLR